MSYENFHKKKKMSPEYGKVYQEVCNAIKEATQQSRFSTVINLEQPDLSVSDNKTLCQEICKELRSKEYSVNIENYKMTVCCDFYD